jgi:hypothetical protein
MNPSAAQLFTSVIAAPMKSEAAAFVSSGIRLERRLKQDRHRERSEAIQK